VVGATALAPYTAVAPKAVDMNVFDAGVDQEGGNSFHTFAPEPFLLFRIMPEGYEASRIEGGASRHGRVLREAIQELSAMFNIIFSHPDFSGLSRLLFHSC
jgi:hypothetical protein